MRYGEGHGTGTQPDLDSWIADVVNRPGGEYGDNEEPYNLSLARRYQQGSRAASRDRRTVIHWFCTHYRFDAGRQRTQCAVHSNFCAPDVALAKPAPCSNATAIGVQRLNYSTSVKCPVWSSHQRSGKVLIAAQAGIGERLHSGESLGRGPLAAGYILQRPGERRDAGGR